MINRFLKLGIVFIVALILLAGVRLTLGDVDSAKADDNLADVLVTVPSILYDALLDNFPVITDPDDQHWVGISGDCVAYRNNDGSVQLYNTVSDEKIAITTEADEIRKLVISDGIVVWRQDRLPAERRGLWGYYHPDCSESRIFGDQIIGPFYIVSRANAHAPSLSGEMLTFDTWSPKGWWFVAFIELDADNNGVPDAAEPGYVPSNPDIENVFTPISYPYWEGEHGQRISDIYWGDDYKISCWYSDSGGMDRLECLDLNHLQEPEPWSYRFQPSPDARPVATYQGSISVDRDLVVWTDYRDSILSGQDLYIADLDFDDDGILNADDPTPGIGPAEFVLVNRPWHQEHPDIQWPYVVWTDGRDQGQQDVYAIDLSLDSDGDGIPNWRDPDRSCIDPAEIRITMDASAQLMPEVSDGTVVWIDMRNESSDIYGAQLQPVQPQPRVPVTGTPQEKALYWIYTQTVQFPQVSDIPGYINATEMITRYKSFKRVGDDEEHVIKAWYTPTVGSYGVSFDYCHFGTAEQKRFLGRFGRGFIYDQALMLIAHTMVLERAEAEDIAQLVSSFQNTDQLPAEFSGCFGFSFNGQGYWDEKDNFYDLNYIRFGANGWIGYGYLFFARHFDDPQFMEVMTRAGDCILRHQVLDTEDPRYGLFTGGFGSWPPNFPDIFIEEDIEWVSAEHNIDIYFFLRDLGWLTGETRYIEAASLLKSKMINLWDPENPDKGCFNQGMGGDGTPDPFDALDACTWGAMYWIAIGDLDKAKSSLDYVDTVFSNTVTVSDTIHASPVITIQGYKPYGDSPDMVWSEGSLGAAMAYEKLANALKKIGDPQWNIYHQKAVDIVSEMTKLQELDPNGGLFYTAYSGEEVIDFPRAPSMAGTAWFVMVLRAMEDEVMLNAFWGPEHHVFLPLIIKS